ncbi:MFS transporter [Clostridium thermopalmarium]|uniref:Putative bacilysin exporter BacE n=1 Tax=Clostridium thermopalmarium DSM 5974 TaxID=1121340 RepID=A0A2T0AZE3_9CLOT|nr:MFS transporter [Clostridium thermopalmarium]PRR76585.1 putative bacilysin exporter BacE [Clostridium thermopalmarium DSM 5974]PVZ28302.1 DHA3 family macrolide efflux protein-like MFS transporter [Clostridium thermopalmarium DSM 5974]
MNKNWKKNTILFLISQTISLFGSSLVQYAITWYITLQTQSGIMMTISIICGFLPTFFLSPFAGVWADRYNRKKLIMLSDSLIAISTLILAILFLKGYNDMWMLFVVSAIRAFGSGVQTPAVGAFLPQIVPEDRLTKVNATNSSIQSLIMLISPMLSGALLNMASIEIIFFIDVITAAIAVSILLVFLNVPVHEKALNKQVTSYFSDMHEGYVYIKNHDYVKRFFLFCAIFNILVAPAAFLTPLQVTRSFGDDVWRLTAIEMIFSIGMMIGGVVMASWGGFKNRIHTMALSSFVIGICTFALGIVPNFWIYLSFMMLFGIVMPIFNTLATVLLQEKVEENFLGRVFSVLGMISSIMMPLGMLVFGPLADIIKIEWLLIGTGLLLFSQGFFMLSSKVLIEAGKPASE